jgi:hypothetical protein
VNFRGDHAVKISEAGIVGLEKLSVTIFSGVYFLVLQEHVVYVGQSTNVLSRIGSHSQNPLMKFDASFYVPIQRKNLLEAERKWIKEFDPQYNRECWRRETSWRPETKFDEDRIAALPRPASPRNLLRWPDGICDQCGKSIEGSCRSQMCKCESEAGSQE